MNVIGKSSGANRVSKSSMMKNVPLNEFDSLQSIDLFNNDSILNSNEILSVILNETLILITDTRGVIQFVNDMCCETLGYQADELIGKHTRIFKTGLHSKSFYQNLWETLLSGMVWKGEIATKRKNGSFSWNFMSMHPLIKNGHLYGFLTLRTDITEQKQVQNDLFNKIERIQHYDLLTGLPNSKSFSECLRKEINLAKENNTALGIVQLDLDDFKYINNTFGYNSGNQLLVDFSKRVKETLKDDVVLFRQGGDGFYLLIKEICDLDDIPRVVTMINEQIHKKPFEAKGNEVYLSASMGVSVFPFSGENEEVLLKNAETAMYRAKRNGKNQYQIFSPTMNLYGYKQFTLKNDSKKALLRDEFCIYYQPRFNPLTNEMVSAEALIRWNHPRWGIVSPNEFIVMAEESGLIVQIGEWLIRKVCNQIKLWESENLPIKRISINLSAVQLLQPHFAKMVSSILTESGVEAKWIEFEITETVIIQKEEQVLETLNKLRNIGIMIALDDFGTGYSSLNYLRKFPCETIKLDKSLIDEIHRDRDSYEIIASTINLCHKLNKTVVAEGVETIDQLSLLKEFNCDEIQGYYYSKPIEEPVLKDYLIQSKWVNSIKSNHIVKINQRKAFRIPLEVPMQADMTIDGIGDQHLSIEGSQVAIQNIGPGGLCFYSAINMPVKEDIILQFKTELFYNELKIKGYIVWSKEVENSYKYYGVKFLLNEQQAETFIKTLKHFQMKLASNPVVPGCRLEKV
jgi:diguanylate cyclase (GGDEF)-like protein/PAS domain S-box-containing protein